MMPFTRPKNLYLVHGWKVGVAERNVVLFQKGEEARALGISITVSGDGQKFFVGQLLATVEATEGEDYVGRAAPDAPAEAVLTAKITELGINTLERPMLYMIVA